MECILLQIDPALNGALVMPRGDYRALPDEVSVQFRNHNSLELKPLLEVTRKCIAINMVRSVTRPTVELTNFPCSKFATVDGHQRQ